MNGSDADRTDEGDPLTDFDDNVEVPCPHCGEYGSVLVDPLGGAHQQFVQDCEVCCRPWDVVVRIDATGLPAVEVKQEGE